TLLSIARRCFINGCLFSIRQVNRIIPFYTRDHAVTQANVAEGTTHHHFVVATTRSIGVEIAFFDSMFYQILTCRTCSSKATCRRDVVRCNGVIKHCQNTRTTNVLDRLRFERHILEEWWLLDRSEEHTSELQSRFDLVCRL